ncbi:MAG: hypothetical protein ACYC1M_00370 [Armatimonadota bacterium]
MFCPDCGLETTEGNRFCKRCGQRLSHGSNAIQEELINAVTGTNGQAEGNVTGVEFRIEQLLQDAMRCQSEGRYQEALMICEAIIEVDKTNTSAHSMMAIVYERMGKTALAIEQLRIVVQHNPGSIADQIKLGELQQSIGLNPSNTGHSSSRPVQFTAKKPVNPLLLAAGSAAAVFILGAIVLNNTPNSHSAIRPTDTSSSSNNLVPTPANNIAIPQAQPNGNGNPLTPNSGGVIQPYVAGDNTQAAQQTNPILQAPTQQNYQARPSGNAGGGGLSSIPALPPITGLTTERDTPTTTASQPASVKPEPKPETKTTPENNGPTGIYEITVNSGSSNRPRPTQSGTNEADMLIRIAAEKSAKGDYRGAIESYTAAQNYGANSASISNSIAQNHRRLNNIQDARKSYQDALKKANDAISRGVNVPQATRDKENAEQGLKACGD